MGPGWHVRHTAVAAGAALLLYGARRYFLNWGTTKQECRMRLPGDELMRQPALQTTEGVWIQRSAADVWPWLVQMGQDRGGWYSYEIVENLFGRRHRSADRIHPEWQKLEYADLVRLTPAGWIGPREGIALSVAEVVDERTIVLRAAPPDLACETVWTFHLIPHGDDRCRLLIRTRVALRHPGEVLLAEFAEPATALLTRGMLRGIRRRSEDADLGNPLPSTLPTSTG